MTARYLLIVNNTVNNYSMFVYSKLFIGGLSGKTTAGQCVMCNLIIVVFSSLHNIY